MAEKVTRRNFIGNVAAGVIGANALSGSDAAAQQKDRLKAPAKEASGRTAATVAPSDRVRIGVIGAGSRGQELMRKIARVPGVEFAGLCDVYEPRFASAQKIAGQAAPTFDDYRRLLDQKNIDAVLIASPLSFHHEHMAGALGSERHVLGEKSFALTLEGCDRVRRATRESGKWFQIGHQYRYAPWAREAVRRVKAGEIGKVSHIFGYWHRNNNWRRPVPAPKTEKLERLINWRLYREFSGGLLAELGSHQVDLANWVFDALPESVMGSGGIQIYHDGRETADNVQAIFEYPGGRKFVFSSLLNNHKVGYQLWICGTDGNCEITLEDATFFYEPKRADSAMSGEIIERGVKTGASYSTKGDMPYRGEGSQVVVPAEARGDATFFSCQDFVNCVRNNKRPFADETVGWNAGASIALANKAIEEDRRIKFADYMKSPKI